MGLKKSNYNINSMGITLPEAYAMIIKTEKKGEKGYAIFGVQLSREKAEEMVKGKVKPIEEHRIDFDVIRNENDYETAYKRATYKRTEILPNPETGIEEETIVESEFFHDWENDIVSLL